MRAIIGAWGRVGHPRSCRWIDIGDRVPSGLLWRGIAAAAVCAVLGLVAFGAGARVPLLGWIDLAIHEAGHVATYLLPDLATAMAGSVAQVLVPVLIAAHFCWRREPLSALLCLAWAGASARDVSVYIADAPVERLQLIGGMHDWAFALGPEGFAAMDRAGAVAATVSGVGFGMVAVAVAGCLVVPFRSAAAPASPVPGIAPE